MARLKPCPFCGAKVPAKEPYLHHMKNSDPETQWTIYHSCDAEKAILTVCMSAYGRTREEVIER